MVTKTKLTGRMGRPKTVMFKERARFDIFIEAETKRRAIDNVGDLGHPDLTSFVRRCFELAASGEAAAIPQLRGSV